MRDALGPAFNFDPRQQWCLGWCLNEENHFIMQTVIACLSLQDVINSIVVGRRRSMLPLKGISLGYLGQHALQKLLAEPDLAA